MADCLVVIACGYNLVCYLAEDYNVVIDCAYRDINHNPIEKSPPHNKDINS